MNFLIVVVSSCVVTVFIYLINIYYLVDIYMNWLYNDIEKIKEYDYIVVGAGTAGATLASKLVDYKYSTLLIESGGSPPPFIDIPLLSPVLQLTPYNWQYVTASQKNSCKALINHQSKWSVGKILGGSSRLNYMVHVRGHYLDYNDWFPDFKEITDDEKGFSIMANSIWNTEIANKILDGIQELSYKVTDLNNIFNTGFMKVHSNIKNGQRWSSDKLLYFQNRKYLHIITHSHVDKILIENQKAVGVAFRKFDESSVALARKGVIISAGSIGSPKLLMLSGIGPRKHLENMKIDVIADLPVGKNLVDHIITGLDLVTLNSNSILSLFNALNPISMLNYFLQGKGPWTSAGVEVVGTFYSDPKVNNTRPPDIQIMVMPTGISQDNGIVLKKTMGITDKVYKDYFEPLSHNNTITIAPVLLHPKSYGEIKLRSSNPNDKPIIDPKYLSNKEDVDVLIKGIKFVKALVKTNAMKSLGASIYDKHFPGCEDKKFDSDEYWECYIRHLTLTTYHPAGTCRMNDVVDSSFRVYGISNLMVVDASVLPALPSGNINTAVAMLAVKAARLIKKISKKNISHEYCYFTNICNLLNICDTICYAY